jgi:hypothetical protein
MPQFTPDCPPNEEVEDLYHRLDEEAARADKERARADKAEALLASIQNLIQSAMAPEPSLGKGEVDQD